MKSLAEIFDEENSRSGLLAETAAMGLLPTKALSDVPRSSGVKLFDSRKVDLKADLPARLKIIGWGENQSAHGVFRVGNRTAAVLSANQKNGYERVAIDFDHCSVPGTESNKRILSAGQPPLIFGYGDVVPKVGDGIYLENISWTPLGQQHAKNFEDISPALKDEESEVTFIHSAALTPNGALQELPSLIEQMKTFCARPENQKAITEAKTFSAHHQTGRGRVVDLAEIFNRDNQTAIAALSASAAPGKPIALPDRAIILPWGRIGESTFYVGKTSETMLPKVQAALNCDPVPIYQSADFDDDGDIINSAKPIGMAGIDVEEMLGIFLDPIKWMDGAAEAFAQCPCLKPILYVENSIVIGIRAIVLSESTAIDVRSLPQYITLSAGGKVYGQRIDLGRIAEKENRQRELTTLSAPAPFEVPPQTGNLAIDGHNRLVAYFNSQNAQKR